MHGFIKAAALIGVVSLLVACHGSGGGSALPALTSSTSTASTAQLAESGNFKYQAAVTSRPFATGTKAHAQVPPPSVCAQAYGFACYTPAEIRTAYNVPSAYTGSGQTIVIVDAFGSPTIQQDVRTFDEQMNLPDISLRVLYPFGAPAGFDSAWATETSLDVEWAHAIAPRAHIDLVIAPTNLSSDVHAAEAYAVSHALGSVVSMSFGASEATIPAGAQNKLLQHADSVFQQAKNAHITMIASAGDTGATPSFPASDPLVLSVGGTSLFMSDNGTYQRETVWNDSIASLCPFHCGAGVLPYASGGAPSSVFKAPSYQHNMVNAASRDIADVSYNAGLYTAVLVYMSFFGPGSEGLYFVGGTSSGSPQWAAIVALANQAGGRHVGYINQALYDIAKGPEYHRVFHDVTVGNDGLFGGPSQQAGPGYDMPTGLGSPNAAHLIPALLQATN